MRRNGKQPEDHFKEMELWEHLAELRGRIIRSLLYIAVGASAVWVLYDDIWYFLWRPLIPILIKVTGTSEVISLSIMEMFFVKLQIALVGGLIFAIPLITGELWGFIAPGLTRSERKGFYFVGPLAVLFFLSGLSTAYLILPMAFRYFAGFFSHPVGFFSHGQGPTVHFFPQVIPYVLFLVKMCLAFGIVFELPVVLMFLGWVGIINSRMMVRYWRHAIVGCSAIAAVATPSNDAPSMLMMGVPLIGLYFLSIALVKFVEGIRGQRAAPEWESSGDLVATRAIPAHSESAVATETAQEATPETQAATPHADASSEELQD